MKITPNEQDFKEWLSHPVTRAVKDLLERKREENHRAWEGGSYSDWNSHTHAIINAGTIGECKAFAFVQELDYETFLGELDEERKRPSPAGESGADSSV